MEFLEKYSFVKKMQRRCEILEQQLWRLLENGAADNRFDAVALAFDKANSRYKQALAELAPWVSVKSYEDRGPRAGAASTRRAQ